MTKTKTITKKVKEPITGKTYIIKQRSEVNPKAGSIRGLWEKKVRK
jgi:hypothetical protein